MAWSDLKSQVDSVSSLAPTGNRTSSADGSAADLSDAVGAVIVIHIGAWTDGTHEFVIEERDTGGSWSAVADGDLNGSEPSVTDAADDNSTFTLGYVGQKNEIRVTTTVSGTTTGAEYSAAIVKELRNISSD